MALVIFFLIHKDLRKFGSALNSMLCCLPLESKMLHLNVEYLQEHYEEPESHVGGFRNAGKYHDSHINLRLMKITGLGTISTLSLKLKFSIVIIFV